MNSNTETHATEPGLPFSKVGLDLVEPLPETKLHNTHIIVLVDYFTKWVEAEPLNSTESKDIIKFLVKNIIMSLDSVEFLLVMVFLKY